MATKTRSGSWNNAQVAMIGGIRISVMLMRFDEMTLASFSA